MPVISNIRSLAIQVNKKLLGVVGIVFLMIVLAGVGFYISWRLTQDEAVTPTAPEAAEGDAGICILGGDVNHHTVCNVNFDASHRDLGDGTVEICATIKSVATQENRTVTYANSCYCPDRDLSYCNVDNFVSGSSTWGCFDNCTSDSKQTLLTPGASTTYCRIIPADKACGLVQWDIGVDSFALDNSCTGSDFFGYLYYFGTMDCPAGNQDVACSGMTSSPADSGGLVTVNDKSTTLSVTANATDSDGAVSKISICYAVADQPSTYYSSADVWTCETTESASGTYTISHPYNYYESSVKNPNGLAVNKILFVTNVYDEPSKQQFCTSNPAFGSGCEGIMWDGNICSGADCPPCTLGGTNCCRLTAKYSDEPTPPACGDGTLHSGEECELGDPSGTTCSWSSSDCNQQTCKCTEEPPQNPDWDIGKRGTASCVDEGTENVSATIDYVITVMNVGDAGSVGEVDYVMDTFDSAISSDWILSTTPTVSSVGSSNIQWALSGADRQFTYNVPRRFEYSVNIPSSMFGQLITNIATARLSTGEDIMASEDLTVTCEGYTPTPTPTPKPGGKLPETGLLDSLAGQVALGGMLIGLGIVLYRTGPSNGAVNWITSVPRKALNKIQYTFGSAGRKDRWEDGVVKKVDRDREK